MVDRYWRKIESVQNDIENSMQISSILLKLKVYDKKLDGLSKIGNNENNVSSNLSKIGNKENNISSNLSKINDNENSISNNLVKIYSFTQYILKSSKNFEQTYIIEKHYSYNKHNNFWLNYLLPR